MTKTDHIHIDFFLRGSVRHFVEGVELKGVAGNSESFRT